MKILLCPMGSAGDVFPFLGIGTRLKQLGCSVTLYTADYFQHYADDLGFDFVRLGKHRAYEDSITNPLLWHPTKSFSYLYERMVLPTLGEQFETVTKVSASGGVILVNCFGFGALCAAEKYDANVVSVHLQPSVLASLEDPPALPQVYGPRLVRRAMLWLGGRFAIDPTVRPSLNQFRATKGMPPVRNILQWWNSKKLNLLLFPQWFAEPAGDWPKPFLQTSFPLWDAGQNGELPNSLLQFLKLGSPPVALTAGSANVHASKFFRDATLACAKLNLRPLYLTADAALLPSPLPENGFASPFVSLRKLLPHCGALVNHGGIGTVSQAISAGIPQIISPLAHDQFDNADRITKLHLGVSIKKRNPSEHDFTKALKEVYGSALISQACRTYQARLSNEDGIAETVKALLSFIDRNRI